MFLLFMDYLSSVGVISL